MAVWADKKEGAKYGPFDGCLMVMNIGEDTKHVMTPEFHEQLTNAVADAHASGWVVLWVFDNETGAMKLPDDWDVIEDMDFVRMMFDVCGRKDSNFPTLPGARMEQFKAMAQCARSHNSFDIRGRATKIMGSCSIDGVKVLMPLIDVV